MNCFHSDQPAAVRQSSISFGLVACVFFFALVSPVEAGWSLPECWKNFWRGRAETKLASRAVVADQVASTLNDVSSSQEAPTQSRVLRWAQKRQPNYGLDAFPAFDTRRPLVVFLHGLNSRPEDLRHLVNFARRAGRVCSTFRYPNDQPIEKSARLLSEELRRVRRGHHGPVYLVTHSMGGLVARAAIEDPDLDPGNVRRLVMIAPPNQGSNLARYACSLDVYEYLTSAARRRESGMIAGSVSDGLAEAVTDLEPGSDFLANLNGRPRNPQVRYSIILGTAGVVEPDKFRWVDRVLDRSEKKCSWVGCAREQYEAHVLANEEVFVGLGDGLVSISNGKLSGVTDVVYGDFSHGGVLAPAGGSEFERIRAQILRRLVD